MTEYDGHDPGTFCWIELSTSDQLGATAFYSNLFGWEAEETPIPPDGIYTMFRMRGRYVAAAASQREDERAQGVPPHWNTYVASDDADQTAKAAEAAGGTVLAPPFDVLEAGRMTVLQDPTGAVISAWQARSHPGFGLAGEPGSFSWPELWTPDPDRAGAFYGEVFGWTTSAFDMGGAGTYTIFNHGERRVAGMSAPQPGMEIPPNWLIYLEAADTDATVATAEQNGGRTLMAPMSMEGAGRFGTLADPQGAAFGIVTTQNSA